jgi:hypothetical protein
MQCDFPVTLEDTPKRKSSPGTRTIVVWTFTSWQNPQSWKCCRRNTKPKRNRSSRRRRAPSYRSMVGKNICKRRPSLFCWLRLRLTWSTRDLAKLSKDKRNRSSGRGTKRISSSTTTPRFGDLTGETEFGDTSAATTLSKYVIIENNQG